MKEKATIELFLDKGFQLSKNTLKIVSGKEEEYLSLLKKLNPRPFVVTTKHLEKIDEGKEKKINVVLEESFSSNEKDLTPKKYVKRYELLYNSLKEIILENNKLDGLLSVNKINKETSNFSLVVLVREINKNNVLVEDTSGEIHLYFGEDSDGVSGLEIDDVVGVKCVRKNKKIHIRKIIFPDTSVTREITKLKKNISAFFLFKPVTLEEEKQESLKNILIQTKKNEPIFVYGGWEDEERLNEFSNIHLIDHEKVPLLFDTSGMKILCLKKDQKPNNILKKRIIKTSSRLGIFSVEKPPDIIIMRGDKPGFRNLKGTSILFVGKNETYFTINLKTREVVEKHIE